MVVLVWCCWSFQIMKHRQSAAFGVERLATTIKPSETSLPGNWHSNQNLESLESQLDYSVYLFSLQWSGSDGRPFSKTTQDVWRWKDAVLGDGRDFFVPKPATLSALQSVLLDCGVDECVVLSNCARFEILVVQNDGMEQCDELVQAISQALVNQVQSYQHRKQQNPFWALELAMDSPGAIDTKTQVRKEKVDLVAKELSGYWVVLSGPCLIANHLCTVAAGMAERPSRPDRLVPFRPFSSRDGHILLQLKRTSEIAQRAGSRTGLASVAVEILQHALKAGKGVRNPEKVPELCELQAYGTGDTKYSSEPPRDVTERVAKAAMDRVIVPTVRDALQSLVVAKRATSIADFRRQAEALATNADEMAWIRQCIHEPTMYMRNEIVDAEYVSTLLRTLEEELAVRRTVLLK